MDNEDYISKSKYVRLLNRLNQIKNEMETTSDVFKDIYSLSKNMVTIDNVCIKNDLFNEIKKKEASNITGIASTISSIKNKI